MPYEYEIPAVNGKPLVEIPKELKDKVIDYTVLRDKIIIKASDLVDQLLYDTRVKVRDELGRLVKSITEYSYPPFADAVVTKDEDYVYAYKPANNFKGYILIDKGEAGVEDAKVIQNTCELLNRYKIPFTVYVADNIYLTEPFVFPDSEIHEYSNIRKIIFNGVIYVKIPSGDYAIKIYNTGWSNFIFKKIVADTGCGVSNAIVLQGASYCKIKGNEIANGNGYFNNAMIKVIDTTDEMTAKDNVGCKFEINRLLGSNQTLYGIEIGTGTKNVEGYRFDINGSVLGFKDTGVYFGSKALNNIFIGDTDANYLGIQVTKKLIYCDGKYNQFILHGWTHASDVDIEFGANSQFNCVFNQRSHQLTITNNGYMNTVVPSLKEILIPLAYGTAKLIEGNAGTSYAYHAGVWVYEPDVWKGRLHQVIFKALWDPKSASGGLKLVDVTNGIDVAVFEPGESGTRWDSKDVTDYFKSLTSNTSFRIASKGDGSTAPVFDNVYLLIRVF